MACSWQMQSLFKHGSRDYEFYTLAVYGDHRVHL